MEARMALKGPALAILLGAVVVPGLCFSLIALAPEPTAEEIAQAEAVDTTRKAEEDAAAIKAQEQAAKEAIYEAKWRYGIKSFDRYRQSLLDPSSAQFRDVWMVEFQGEGVTGVGVCGVVNARNAFGAYVGERPFIAMADVSWTPDHPNFAMHFQDICLDGKKFEKVRV